jgi:hypothetical protein
MSFDGCAFMNLDGFAAVPEPVGENGGCVSNKESGGCGKPRASLEFMPDKFISEYGEARSMSVFPVFGRSTSVQVSLRLNS